MLQFEESLQLGCPAEQFQRMLRDPAFFERKYQEMRMRDVALLSHQTEGDTTAAAVRYAAPLGGAMPPMARRIVGDELVITQHENWDFAGGTAQMRQEIRNAPARIGSKVVLADTPEGLQMNMDWQIKVQVPIVGGQLEKMIADALRLMIKGEFRVTRKLIVEYA